MFKNAEEREADRQARADQARAAAEQRKHEAFLAGPVGQATVAKRNGDRFFEIQLEVGGHDGSAGFGSAEGRRTTASSAVTLGKIEQLGWHLEHVGYYFMVTGESSTKHVLVSGDETAVRGITIGVYLFRNTDARPASA
jgi:hypothetical protein